MKKLIVDVTSTILPVIEKYRHSAQFKADDYSDTEGMNFLIPCSDKEVARFIYQISDGKETVSLKVSSISYTVTEYCSGASLFPVEMTARKIPGESWAYWVNVTGLNIEENFILRGW